MHIKKIKDRTLSSAIMSIPLNEKLKNLLCMRLWLAEIRLNQFYKNKTQQKRHWKHKQKHEVNTLQPKKKTEEQQREWHHETNKNNDNEHTMQNKTRANKHTRH